MNTIPTIQQIKALDGRVCATLTATESEVLDFYRAQGRKFNVAVSIENKADAAELAVATTRAHADEIMMGANSVVRVKLGAHAEAAWAARS